MICYMHKNDLTSTGNKVNSGGKAKTPKAFGKTGKGRDRGERGERALQISGSAQRPSGARPRKHLWIRLRKSSIDKMPLIKCKESK